MSTPEYVTIPSGQMRLYTAGSTEGPNLLVLPGMVLGAAARADRWAAAAPDWRVTAIEPPGVGGSCAVPGGPERQAAAVAEACRRMGLVGGHLIAHDLHGPMAAQLLEAASDVAVRAVWLDEGADGWARSGVGPGDLDLAPDGRHLVQLFAHLRDRQVLDPYDTTRPRRHGPPLPTAEELDATVVAAATHPRLYATLWREHLEAVAALVSGESTGLPRATAAAVHRHLDDWRVGAGDVSSGPWLTGNSMPTADGTRIRRGYVQTPSGRFHVRRAGEGNRTLLAFHSAPGGAAPIESVATGLAGSRTVLAPDFLGNGDSEPRVADVDIGLLAREMLELVDVLDLQEVDLWGTHTGACIALEMAVVAPDRVGRVVLEAPPLLDTAFTGDILENYLPPLVPDRWGLHLLQAWNMRRDMFLFWPWYREERKAMRSLGVPPLQMLHDWTVGLLSSGGTYSLSYRAAFEYDTRTRLAQLTRPVLITAGPADMLADGLDRARSLVSREAAVMETPATVWYPGHTEEEVRETLAIYDSFLHTGDVPT